MPTYIPKSLKSFLHTAPKHPCYAYHKWTVPAYGQSTQYVKVPVNTPPLEEKVTKDIQAKVVLLLYDL